VEAAPATAPKPPPTAAPMPAPRPPPAIAPMTAPVPAPIRPPPSARSPGLYGSAEAAVANSNPAPITLATIDCLFIRFLPTRCREGDLLRCRPSVKEFCSSFRSVKKQTASVAVPFHVSEETKGGLPPRSRTVRVRWRRGRISVKSAPATFERRGLPTEFASGSPARDRPRYRVCQPQRVRAGHSPRPPEIWMIDELLDGGADHRSYAAPVAGFSCAMYRRIPSRSFTAMLRQTISIRC
jgi:hypothetical protein